MRKGGNKGINQLNKKENQTAILATGMGNVKKAR